MLNLWDPEYEPPVFKTLARNDTGRARGHQGGLVVPQDLQDYFPRLEGAATRERPTIDVEITLELWVLDRWLGTTVSRYQHQTWGGTRSPERRLTSGFSEWRNIADAGDIAIFQRRRDDEYRLRMILIPQNSLSEDMKGTIHNRRWGVVRETDRPIRNTELQEAENTLLAEALAAEVFDENRTRSEATRSTLARSQAFRSAVLKAYESRCALTNEAIISPSGGVSCDAAHIIPVAERGSDVVPNGLCLRKDLHWAFDRGLWTLTPEGRVLLSPALPRDQNAVLLGLERQVFRAPRHERHHPSSEALAWHREHRFIRQPL